MANLTGCENKTNTTGITSWDTYSTSMAVLSALNVFLAITATLGNVLILIALHKVSSIYPPTKLLFRCLAVTDLCVGLISQPVYVAFLISDLLPNTNIDLLDGIKQADEFFFSLLPQVSVLTSAAISVDRFYALSLGLRYRQTVSLRRVRVVIACFWLFSSLAAAGSISVSVHKTVSYISNLLFYILILLSLVISIFSYPKIFLSLRHQQAQIQEHVQPGQPNGGRSSLNIARYKKTVSSIAWVQLALFVCYAPCSLTQIILFYGKIRYSTAISVAYESFVTLIYLNSSLNPILYCWKIRDVRQEVKNTIGQVWCW